MPRGLPASYIKQAQRELGKGASWRTLFKRAWQIYKGTKLPKILKRRECSNPIRVRKMPKRRYRRYFPRIRRRKSFTIPVAPTLGLVAGLVGPSGDSPLEYAMKGDWRSVGVRLVKSYTGYDANSGKFNFAYLWNGVAPLAAGFIVHWIAGKLGVNKVLARSKVPVIRI